MKAWLQSHYRIIIALTLFAVMYFISFRMSIDYVDFHRVYPSGNRTMMEYNMKVARFYFVYLPLGASIPSLLYMLIVFLNSKSK